MNHGKNNRKLNRSSAHRKALFANLATSLFIHEQIKTTLPKAKELKPIAERLITLGKKGSLHHRRLANRMIKDEAALTRLFDKIAPRYFERSGGYTRILRCGFRKGDNAPMAIIELVDRDIEAKGKGDRDRILAAADNGGREDSGGHG